MTDQFFTPTTSHDHCNFPAVFSKFTNLRKNSLVAVIHIGQAYCNFAVYTAPDLKLLLTTNEEFKTYSPEPGWYEHDAEEIIEAVYRTSCRGCKLLPSYGHIRADILAVSITNQRETLVVWDERTGDPLYKAIAANDIRAVHVAETINKKLTQHDLEHIKTISGLPVLPCLPALKICWLQEHVPEVRTAIKNGYCKVGTLDTWIIWKLTRGVLHVTDVTNASRFLLMNINTLNWDAQLLKTFSIKSTILPEIRSCAEDFGIITTKLCVLKGLHIGGIIGDQQAAMLAQMCLHKGQTVAHFDSSLTLLCNTVKNRALSKDLFTTVAYKLGDAAQCMYALEGYIPYCGDALKWLKQNVRVIMDTKEAEYYASLVISTDDVFFVPAFKGLEAPYWRKDARGMLIGLTDKTTKSHIVRAALEAICFQACDILETYKISGDFNQNVIYACGEYSTNSLLMQMFADITGCTVVHYKQKDAISYGAAMCAGFAINLLNMQQFEQGIWREGIDFDTFVPMKSDVERMVLYVKWRRAVSRSLNWLPEKKPSREFKKYLLLGTLLSGIVIASFIVVMRKGKNLKI